MNIEFTIMMQLKEKAWLYILIYINICHNVLSTKMYRIIM